MLMTVLVNTISPFSQDLWKASLAPAVAIEETTVLACQEHLL